MDADTRNPTLRRSSACIGVHRRLLLSGTDLGGCAVGAVAYIRTAWSRRELLRQLAWREAKAGRRQSVLGIAWVFLQPAAYLLVLSAVFSFLPRGGTSDCPYPLFLVVALVPWLFFSGAVTAGVGSVVGMAELVRKVSFPRIFCPMAAMAAHLVNLAAGLVLLFGLILYYRAPLTLQALWVAPALVIVAVLALGLVFLLSALNVHTRDVASATPLVLQLWFFATPIIYPVEMVAPALTRMGLWTVYRLNPMVGVVEAMRAVVLRGEPPPLGLGSLGGGLGGAALVAAVVFVAGAFVFARLERNFADVI
jgi:lipopolysaccharide transport system permease protein